MGFNFNLILIPLVFYVAFATVYLLLLAASYFIKEMRQAGDSIPINRFAIFVPAHNEELLIENLCQSLGQINYPSKKFTIHIIADNCTDKTVDVCSRYPVRVLERNDPSNAGKGQALAWTLQQIDLMQFEAVLVVDADNYVDPEILGVLNQHINKGEIAIQCYNSVGNRSDSWFTELLFVSRTIGNLFYHEAKYRLGLSSYLMGNGLCFSCTLLRERGWTAFSTSEDWEYYAHLIEIGINISFASRARVYHQESRSLKQATSQRLRWSSGRFNIAKTLGVRMMVKGLKNKNYGMFDASLPLLLPNYSLLINLTVVGLLVSLIISMFQSFSILSIIFFLLIIMQFSLFLTGAIISGLPLKTMKAAVCAPFFLFWKGIIDLLCITGIHKEKKWVRTKRHQSNAIQETDVKH